ncbi:Proline--tRNA ligase [Chlamydiales bacterium SCGC AB-751-O23]|jgi:prolyl-tRNA synthetase|nr:Proline--tRNA ligase [Chlamydiales bacterium SCGC AB-751-O23]
MRLSQMFFKTFKEEPAEAEILSHVLLEKSGYIKKLDKGLYSLTPLMWRVTKKLLAIIREELDRCGLQEVQMPFLQPKRIWEQSGRWDAYTSEKLLYHFKDREDRDMCLGPTHEEAVTSLVTNWLVSYKQLPANLYQISQKFRDEIRCRFGLMRAKEFTMKDAYAFCEDEASMDQQYDMMREAYSKIFNRLGLDFAIVTADGGSIGKGRSEEFQVLAKSGEDLLMVCDDLTTNVEAAVSVPPSFNYEQEEKELKLVDTPKTKTIEDLVSFADIDIHYTMKTLIYKLTYNDSEDFVAVCVRGDRQVNEIKVKNFFSAIACELALEEKIKELTGSTPGSLGPHKLKIKAYADLSCKDMRNFTCGANISDKHYFNVSWERDCPEVKFEDFLQAEEGDGCPSKPGKTYTACRGIEVGHIFNLGSKYSEAMGATFLDRQGKKKPFQMGCYGIGVSRLAQSCIEQKADEKGLIWPMEIAPFHVSIFAAGNKEEQVNATEKLYVSCQEAGIEALLDDRKERMGFKIKDCDLMGIPLKVIIGRDFLSDGKCEIETRTGDKHMIAFESVTEWIKDFIFSKK